uniref:WD_REPEATS_REGION domain-containing protein n=1 Tax=Angiostrongylus cantonensis TaxID=6313 RepID=A0A0K0D3B5_ANGCA
MRRVGSVRRRSMFMSRGDPRLLAVEPEALRGNCALMTTAHQVITGALNKGENVYATGTVDGATFIACAVGSDVVILGADFSRVQIIPGCSHHTEQLVSSVSCCHDSGKIAATYGNIIRVFEPTSVLSDKSKSLLNYQWIASQCFTVKEQVNAVLWNMDGLRMTVVIGDELFLYQHRSLTCISRPGSTAPVMFSIAEEVLKLAQRPKYIKFSPDGMFLAVSGENDYLVKLFYQESGDDTRDQLVFGFVPLYHPAPVRGLEWRRTGRYMPRKCIQAVLMTWCVDNTSRIWKETPPPELAMIDLNGDGGTLIKFFELEMPEKRRRGEELPHALGLRAQIGKSSSFSDLQCLHHSYNNVQFHLAATINAETGEQM